MKTVQQFKEEIKKRNEKHYNYLMKNFSHDEIKEIIESVYYSEQILENHQRITKKKMHKVIHELLQTYLNDNTTHIRLFFTKYYQDYFLALELIKMNAPIDELDILFYRFDY